MALVSPDYLAFSVVVVIYHGVKFFLIHCMCNLLSLSCYQWISCFLQIDVLEAEYNKAYAIREKEKEDDDSNLAHSLHCLVRVTGKDGKTWSTQYFKPEDD